MKPISAISEISLREYQSQIVDWVFQSWQQGVYRTLVQLCTGGGKTVIFVKLAQELLIKQEPVLIIAHRRELIQQAAQKIRQIIGKKVKVGIIKAGEKPSPQALVQVASVQTLIRREYPPASLVIIDEAHHSYSKSYAKIIQHYSDRGSYVLGVTATPLRTDGKGLNILSNGVSGYEKLIVGQQMSELVAEGYLVPTKIYAPHKIIDAENSGIKTTAGDYNKKDLTELVENNLIIGDVIDTWKRYAAGKKTVLFAVSVAHSKLLAKAFKKAGIKARHLDGTTPLKTRKQILRDFSKGKVLVLCQHSIVSEGVDIPDIEAIQLTCPTKSLVSWFQKIGRAMRPAPGKETAIIIDHTDTHLNLPWPEDPIAWSLSGTKVEQDSSLLCVSCPECGFAHQVDRSTFEKGVTTCPECQHFFGVKLIEKKRAKARPRLQSFETVRAEFKLAQRWEEEEEIIDPKSDVKEEFLLQTLRKISLILLNKFSSSEQKLYVSEIYWRINFYNCGQALAYIKDIQDYPQQLRLKMLKTLICFLNHLNTKQQQQSKWKTNPNYEKLPQKSLFDEFLEFKSPKSNFLSSSLDKQQTIDAVFATRASRGYKPGWVGIQLLKLDLDLNLEDWENIAFRLGYKKGWGYYKWKETQ